MSYQKHFVPLESDPEIFTQLMRDLGTSERLEFIDVWSIQEQIVPGPVLALIVIFPDKDTADKSVPGFEKRELANRVLWFKQTINNACGLYALLHAVCNGSAKDFVQPESGLGKIIESCQLLDPPSRAKLIEESPQIETVYANAALKGSTEAPEATEEVECHYVCFTKASGSALWLLDGDRDGPLESAETLGLDWKGAGLDLIQKFIEDNSHNSSDVGIMALVETSTSDSMLHA